MRKSDVPIIKDLVLIGGGHSHVAVLKRFGMRPVPGIRLTVICRDVHTPYSGMLPGMIAGHYGFDDIHIDLGPLSRFANARLYDDEVTGLDPERRLVFCRGRPPVPYDVLSINIGSTPRVADVPGAAEHAVAVKPIGNFIARWEALRDRVLAQDGKARVAVVGAGAGGVEILFSVQHRLRALLMERGMATDGLEFHLFADRDTILPTHNPRVRDRFMRTAADRGATIHTGERVGEVGPGRLKTEQGNEFQFDEILWVTAAGAASWPGDAGLDVDEAGFIRVTDTLQTLSHRDIFAVGDIATMVNHPRPKSGVFAVREGPPLERNLRRVLLGKPPRPFKPQTRFLSLITTGDKYAVASRGGWSLSGRWVWRWKDWIDRRFMEKYNDLPQMAEETLDLPHGLAGEDAIRQLSTAAMRCGGCGAKIGAPVLERVLAGLAPVQRDDVLVGLKEPDDAAVVEVPPGKAMVHTVDFFRAMIEDPFIFGKVAANHSLGDIYAMGGEPQTALAIATAPYGLEEKLEDTLTQLMAGALTVLNEAGAALAGGHTGEAAELSLGFAVNGLIDPDRVMRKAGLTPGDRLILTKPIGTGVLFAADMRAKAKGRWITGALETMTQSNRDAATCLLEHGARACTDVTGFGVLGHLVEMVKPSGVDVRLDLGAIPLLDGAEDCVRAGIVSSLQPQNLRLRRTIANIDQAGADPRYPLLFDPQTAGGLLAGVPEDKADACLAELHRLGYAEAAIVGAVLPKSGQPEPVTVRV